MEVEVEEILYTGAQASKASQLSERTLLELRKSGDLPFVRIGSKIVRYRPSDIKALAAKYLVTNGAAAL